MQTSEMTVDGLRRTLRVVIPAATLRERLDDKIAEVGPKINLRGFRPGKVPAAHVKKLYGSSLLREIIEEEVQRSTQTAIAEADVRLASEPQLKLETDLEAVTAGDADLAFTLDMDVMPDFEPVDPASIALDRPIAPVEDSQVDETLGMIAKSNRAFVDKDGVAANEDVLTIDFIGRIDGEAFEGGAAEGASLALGSGQFIPGFEEQLIGVSAGESRTVNVSFPEDYPAPNLKGKAAAFDVTVKALKTPQEAEADDALAERIGFTSLGDLRDAVRKRIEQDHAALSRAKAKRALFDKLDAVHAFDLPGRMVDNEFNQIWAQLEQERAAGELDPNDAGKSDDELRVEYRRIAERRVRLGLVLAEIGRRNNVQIREEEVAAAVHEQARRLPGRERQVVEFYQKNPNALAQLRAPIFEEKVVDFVLELAKVTDVTVSREDLMKEEPGLDPV